MKEMVKLGRLYFEVVEVIKVRVMVIYIMFIIVVIMSSYW